MKKLILSTAAMAIGVACFATTVTTTIEISGSKTSPVTVKPDGTTSVDCDPGGTCARVTVTTTTNMGTPTPGDRTNGVFFNPDRSVNTEVTGGYVSEETTSTSTGIRYTLKLSDLVRVR